MKNLKNEHGFTLVELMVVVAIIGILSAVAIPNFKKYQAKSKTSEAKLQLASLYSAETATMADFDTYADCLEDIGFEDPKDGGQTYYSVGFATGGDGNALAILNGIGTCASDAHYAANRKVGGTTAITAAPANAGTADETAFTAGAEGYIVNKATATSQFTINEGKAIVNTQRGY